MARENRAACLVSVGAAPVRAEVPWNCKEENMMYPMLDQALGEDAEMLFGESRRSMAGKTICGATP